MKNPPLRNPFNKRPFEKFIFWTILWKNWSFRLISAIKFRKIDTIDTNSISISFPSPFIYPDFYPYNNDRNAWKIFIRRIKITGPVCKPGAISAIRSPMFHRRRKFHEDNPENWGHTDN